MTTYIIRRLAILPLVMLGLSIMIFAMLQLLDPTERAALYVSDIPKNPAALQAIVENTASISRLRCSSSTGWAWALSSLACWS